MSPEVLLTRECGSESNSSEQRGGSIELRPPTTCTTVATHTHSGGAAGHRTDGGRLCSVDTAGWRSARCVRQHGRMDPTLGPWASVWSEKGQR